MTDVIFKKGDRKDGSGKPQPFTYVLWEDAMDAFTLLRKANTNGYSYDKINQPYPAPAKPRANPPEPKIPKSTRCCLIPYVMAGSDGKHVHSEDEFARTNCSSTIANVFALALSHGEKVEIAGKTWHHPLKGNVLIPESFYSMLQICDASLAEWWTGSAIALAKHNVSERVKGNFLRRGDTCQINWMDYDHAKKGKVKVPVKKADGSPELDDKGKPKFTERDQTQDEANDDAKEVGHSVCVYHARRVKDGETRFLLISAQTDTYGIGVRLNPWVMTLLGRYEGVMVASTGTDDAQWVDRQQERIKEGGFEGPDFVQYALTNGFYYVVNGMDSRDGAAIPKAGFYRGHITRPHRPFPCFPVSLSGVRTSCFTRPKAQKSTSAYDFESSKDTFDLYYQDTEGGDDGFFPIGSGRTWHTGVHFHPENDKNVYAALDGRVVCARLAPPDEKKWPLGSGNFVLLRHELELQGSSKVFYSLYMHLEQTPLPEAGKPDPRLAIPWLRDIVLALPPDAVQYKHLDPEKLHLRIHTLPRTIERRRLRPDKNGNPSPYRGGVPLMLRQGSSGLPVNVGDIFEIDSDPDGVRLWMKQTGYEFVTVKRVVNGGPDGAPAEGDEQTGKIFWTLVSDDGHCEVFDGFPKKFAEKKKKLADGEVVDFWDDKIYVGAGEPIGRAGNFHGGEVLHFEIFSEDLIDGYVKDKKVSCASDDPKMFCDRKTFANAFWDALAKADPALKDVDQHIMNAGAHQDDLAMTREEIVQFFHENPDRVLFRNLVVQCPSIWSDDAKIDQIDQNAKDSFGFLGPAKLAEMKQRMLPYGWWKKGMKHLPGSMSVHFYHPVRFLEWIDELRAKEAAGGKGDALHVSVYEKNHPKAGD